MPSNLETLFVFCKNPMPTDTSSGCPLNKVILFYENQDIYQVVYVQIIGDADLILYYSYDLKTY